MSAGREGARPTKLAEALAKAFPDEVHALEQRRIAAEKRREVGRAERTTPTGDGTPLEPYRREAAESDHMAGYVRSSKGEIAARGTPISREAAALRQGAEEIDEARRTKRTHWTAPPIPKARRPADLPDLSGRVVGRMVVWGYHSSQFADGQWLVRCACGDYEIRRGNFITSNADGEHSCEVCFRSRRLIAERTRSTRESRRGEAEWLDASASGVRGELVGGGGAKVASMTLARRDARVESEAPVSSTTLHWTVEPVMPKRPKAVPDLTGTVCGEMEVIGYWSAKNDKGTAWVVRCACGDFEVRRRKAIVSGAGMSGCVYCVRARERDSGRQEAARGELPARVGIVDEAKQPAVTVVAAAPSGTMMSRMAARTALNVSIRIPRESHDGMKAEARALQRSVADHYRAVLAQFMERPGEQLVIERYRPRA